MYDYFIEYEESCDTEVDLDVIAICCEFTEFIDLTEFQEQYNVNYESIEDIEDQTIVIRINDTSFIIQDF